MATDRSNTYGELLEIARGNNVIAQRRLDEFAAYVRREPERLPRQPRRMTPMLLLLSFALGAVAATIALAVSPPETRNKVFGYFNLTDKT